MIFLSKQFCPLFTTKIKNKTIKTEKITKFYQKIAFDNNEKRQMKEIIWDKTFIVSFFLRRTLTGLIVFKIFLREQKI